MSRIGKMPIPVPKGADIQIGADQITVKGPLGTLTHALTPAAGIVREGDELVVKPGHDSVEANAMSGTLRAVFDVMGVTNVVAKSFGSSNPYNLVRATLNAFTHLSTPAEIAAKRGKSVEEILG